MIELTPREKELTEAITSAVADKVLRRLGFIVSIPVSILAIAVLIIACR